MITLKKDKLSPVKLATENLSCIAVNIGKVDDIVYDEVWEIVFDNMWDGLRENILELTLFELDRFTLTD